MSAEPTSMELQAFVPVISALVGGIVGGLSAIAGQIVVHKYREGPKKKLEARQKELLKKLLLDPNYQWRSLRTLSGTVGADTDTVKRLLIEVGARGRMGNANQWALMTRKPLPDVDEED